MNANDHAPAGQSDVLRSAWKRMVELDLQSSIISKQSMQLRRWVAILGVVATFLAIITNELRGEVYYIVEQILRGLLILVPIVISGMAAYANKFFGGANGLVMRAGSEEIKKEIYLYRTVLRNHPERDKWLSRRMTTIQRRTYKSLGGELIIEPYEGKLPPYYNPDDPNSDPGFSDLAGDDYLRYRVIDQRDWHRRKIIQLKEERLRIQRIILIMGALGALLAAIPPEWTPNWGLASWVALTAAIASAFTGWEQLRGLDKILTIYSRVILELTIIRDEWEAIAPHRRTEADFIALVRAAEDVMWAQNMQYISTMQEAITSGQGDEAELVENMLKEGDAMTLELQSKMLDEARSVLKVASAELGKVVEDSADTVKNMVTTVATTASDLQEKVQTTVETELMSVEELVGGGLDQISTETAAIRTTISQTVDTAMDEVAATRQMVATTTQAAATEAQALRTTAQATADTALTEVAATRAAIQTTTEHVATQASAIRETIQNTVTEQAAATRTTVESTAATIATDVQAIRETVQETATQQAMTARELVEGVSQSLVSETAALHETAQSLTEQVVTESSTVRENVTQTVETVLAGSALPVPPSAGQLREMLEVELTKQNPETKKKAPSESVKRTNEVASESLEALLGEAQTLIDEAADEMKTKMAETVVQQIAEQITEKKKGGRAKRENKEKSDPGGVG